jgi:ABC-2 type transport system permease protein
MNPITTVFWAKLRMARHQIASVRHESKLKVGVLAISALGLWVGAFFLFHWGFEFMLNFGGRGGGEFNFGHLLMGRMLSILALSIFLLLVFSNVLVAFSTLYRSRETGYLLQAPFTFYQLFYVRFIECAAFSSWSLLFLGSPMMLAYGVTTQASLLFYLAAFLFFIPFIIIPASIGATITLILVRIFPRLKLRMMILLGVTALLLFFLYIRGVIQDTRISEDALLPSLLDASARMQSPFLPSTWASEGVLAAAAFRLGDAFYSFRLLLSTALAALVFTGFASHFLFYPGWSYLKGQDRQRFRPPGRGLLNRAERLLNFIPQPFHALIAKDFKLFWRDPTQWSQFVIFFGIMAIYIANLRNTSRYYEQEMWRSFVACLNVGAVTLILATLTSRFIYPLISLEGRRFWILGLAPLSLRQLIWQKFWLSVGLAAPVTAGLSLLSGYMLQLEPIYYGLTVYSVVMANFGLSGLAVGLGSLYPNFEEDDPARILSGMGGTLNLLVSVGYIVCIVGAQTLILQWRILERFTRPEVFQYALAGAVLFITLLSLFCVWAPMRAGLRNLQRQEF